MDDDIFSLVNRIVPHHDAGTDPAPDPEDDRDPDYEYDEPDTDDTPYAPPAYTSSIESHTPGQQQYSGEHYNFLKDFYTSDFLPALIGKVQMSHLSPTAKRAIMATAIESYSSATFLAKQKDTEDSEIGLGIILNILILSCNKVDVNLPEFPHIIELLKEHMRYIATRTVGKDRERLQINRQTVENIQRMGDHDEDQKSKKGLGLFSMFTGRGGGD